MLTFVAFTVVALLLAAALPASVERVYWAVVARPAIIIFAMIVAPPLVAAFLDAYRELPGPAGPEAVITALVDAANTVLGGSNATVAVDVSDNLVTLLKLAGGALSLVAVRALFSREAYGPRGSVVYNAEPLIATYIGFYWALFCYVGLGCTYSRRRRHAPRRAKDVELQWFAIANFYVLFDLPDIAGGTVGWSLNKYRPHLSKWKQSKTYYLLQLTVWPLQCICNEAGADGANFVARLRRDLLYPDLRVAGSYPYPANYQDNVWTHNIHALVSKAHYAKIRAARPMYFFDHKFDFLGKARSLSPPFPVTPDLRLPEGTIAVLFRRRPDAADAAAAAVPAGITVLDEAELEEPLVHPGTKLYVKHTTLEMGAGVFVLEVGDEAGQWELLAVTSLSGGFAPRPADRGEGDEGGCGGGDDGEEVGEDGDRSLDPDVFRLFRLAPEGDWVVQPAMRNCAEVQRWCTPEAPLCSYRVVTTCTAGFVEGASDCLYAAAADGNKGQGAAAKQQGQGGQRLRQACDAVIAANPPQLVGMAFRAGRAGRDQDKLTDGAVFYGVDLVTKKVTAGTTWQQFTRDMPREPSVLAHPDSGVQLAGQSLFFDESSALCRDAHARMCPGVPIVGWDVALSEVGPILVEANAVFMTCYAPVDYWPYMDAMDKALRYIDAHRDAEIAPEEATQASGPSQRGSSAPLTI